MKTDFAKSERTILVYEGGFSDNPKDPGGATMKGITQATYNSWRGRQGLVAAPVKDISDTDVLAIYKMDFWDRTDCDDLPAGVDLCMFDASVNSGVGAATKWAQGVTGIDTDGDFGPKTKTAILAMDPEAFIKDFNARRLGTLKRLPTWPTFKGGWSARITNGQKIELAWAQGSVGPDVAQVHTIGGHTKAKPNDVPTSKTGQILSHAATVGGAVATGAAQGGQALAPASDTLSWVKYILAGLTLIGAIAGLIVYFSQQANLAARTAVAKADVDPDADADLPTTTVLPDGTIAAQAAGAAVSLKAAQAAQGIVS